MRRATAALPAGAVSRRAITTHARAAALAPPYPRSAGGCDLPGHVHGPHCSHGHHQVHSGAGKKEGNRGVVYVKPGVVEIHDLPFPKLELDQCVAAAAEGHVRAVVGTHGCRGARVVLRAHGAEQHLLRPCATRPLLEARAYAASNR